MVKKKSGWVYGLETTSKNGKKKIYVGSTTRTPKKRFQEHLKEINKPNSKTWVGRQKSVKLKGVFYSNNPRKAEKTMKKKRKKSFWWARK